MAEYPQIIRELHDQKYATVYFLQGEEPFYIDNIISHLEQKVLDESQKSFNQYVFYGKEVTLAEVISTARKFPMMGERQVVLVKEAQEMRGWNQEDQQKILTHYLESPVPTTILAFAYKYKSLDKRSKVYKSLADHAIVLNSKRLYDNQLPEWIQSYAQARSMSINPRAVVLLAENIGNNLQRLANEMEKLLLNVQPDQEIDEHAVHRYVGISKDFNIFELQKCISTGNFAKAIRIVTFFAANPSQHPFILTVSGLFSYFTKLLQIHHQGLRDKFQASKVIGVPPFVANEYLTAARRYPLNKVLSNLEYLHQADLANKGINTNLRDEEQMSKELVYRLMH
jgi:DNA polymerase-3 subunit delta